ncbi:unnamed protein product (macronuclear) [Paramecium tetraurelia]|uniref:RRM domain-containing protein n=1 Tax=Paramecium tetraurelia TaxID=5888 RepID=A0BKI2_PARTE|nr:uncharacterized protein GSPATT00029680001 [Paramecium tetraurelia]CAK59049.1 unnamed protein product [Paramecium tetraurelia]|eukprot:XP_001426447.1 hypothetical protein (macronuclear) [Paramecium tetraurelia strain d4-2]
MSKNHIFSKSINIIRDHQYEYKPSQQSGQKQEGRRESEEEIGNVHSTQIQKKAISKKVIMIQNSGQSGRLQPQQVNKRKGILNITKKDEQQVKQGGSYSIFIRNLKENTSQQDLREVIDDDANILGVSINNKQATITFSNQAAAENAIELINNCKERNSEMRAVPNFKQNDKVIVIGQHSDKNKDGRLRMDARESIFDRIQIKK